MERNIRPKRFSTAGPCDQLRHRTLSALTRLPDAQGLTDREDYSVPRAQRQSGETAAALDLADKVNGNGEYCSLYLSLEQLNEVTGEGKGSLVIIGALLRA
jgi:hypothetical protein